MILKISQYDLFNLPIKEGQLYYVVNPRSLYKDFGPEKTDRKRFVAHIINSDYERVNIIRPQNGVNYYVVETNCLWLFDTKWVLKDGDVKSYNLYTYNQSTPLAPVNNSDETITSKTTGDKIIDNNGLAGDGSVIVRDTNRIGKGYIRANNTTGMLDFYSMMSEGFNFYPNGLGRDTEDKLSGSLKLSTTAAENDETIRRQGRLDYYGDIYIHGNIYTLDEVSKAKFDITYSPKDDQILTHKFTASKTYSSTDHTEYDKISKFTIEVREDSCKVNVITYYTKDETPDSVSSSIYDNGEMRIGSDITYTAERTVKSNSVVYKLIGTDNDLVITITGTPLNGSATFSSSDISVKSVAVDTVLYDVVKH